MLSPFIVPSITLSSLSYTEAVEGDYSIDGLTGAPVLAERKVKVQAYLKTATAPKNTPYPGQDPSACYLRGWLVSEDHLNSTTPPSLPGQTNYGAFLLGYYASLRAESLPITSTETVTQSFVTKQIPVGKECTYERGGETGRFIPVANTLSPYPEVIKNVGVAIEGWLIRSEGD